MWISLLNILNSKNEWTNTEYFAIKYSAQMNQSHYIYVDLFVVESSQINFILLHNNAFSKFMKNKEH